MKKKKLKFKIEILKADLSDLFNLKKKLDQTIEEQCLALKSAYNEIKSLQDRVNGMHNAIDEYEVENIRLRGIIDKSTKAEDKLLKENKRLLNLWVDDNPVVHQRMRKYVNGKGSNPKPESL